MNTIEGLEWYKRRETAEEIAEFLRNRWVGVFLESGGWLRWLDRRPLIVESFEDVQRLAEKGGRSFYGTIEVFERLSSEEDVFERYDYNVLGADSFIDIDIVEEDRVEEAWIHALEAARILSDWLVSHGGGNSVYLLWSGAGVHVRVSYLGLTGVEVRGHSVDPVSAAYLVAEYALHSNRERLRRVVESSQGLLKIENVVGRKRLFTAPLSLHKKLDRVAVAFKPEDAGLFTLSWTLPSSYRHDPMAWRRARRGEARRLVEDAYEYFGESLPERTVMSGSPRYRRGARAVVGSTGGASRIGRFPVMALLQAARYYVLNGDLDKAKSFGLNRAIFYAWAKYYGPARSAQARLQARVKRLGGRPAGRVRLERVPGMNEEAPVSDSGWYSMGGIEQRPEDFDRNVARKFEEKGISFEEAWRSALEYVSRFPRHVLRDPRLFYERVYLPVRDLFEEKVLGGEMGGLYRYRFSGRGRDVEVGGRRVRGLRRERSLLDYLDKD